MRVLPYAVTHMHSLAARDTDCRRVLRTRLFVSLWLVYHVSGEGSYGVRLREGMSLSAALVHPYIHYTLDWI